MTRRRKHPDSTGHSRSSFTRPTSPSPTRPPSPLRRPALVTVAVVVLAAAAIAGASWRSHVTAAARLPGIPELTGRPDALRRHVLGADAAARRSPRSAEFVGALGMAYHADLFYEQAASAYVLAAEIDTQSWRWTYYRALVHLERGQAAEAGDALRAVVARQPDFGLAWWRLGETALKQTQYDEGDAAYARAEQSPATTTEGPGVATYAGVGRARVALLRGNAAAAQTLLVRVVETEPRFGAAHRVLSEAFRVQGRSDDADRHGARGSALRAYAAPNDPLVDALADISRSSVFLLRHAASIDLARDPARRERLVQRALEADPKNPDVVYEMGALLQQLRRPADAVPYFVRHLDMVADDQQTMVQIGKCYSDLGRLDEAEKTLRKALTLGDDAVGFYNLGVVLEQHERLHEAEASYRRAITLGPGLASARNNLGGLLARSGRLSEATKQLLASIRLDPSTPDAYTNLSAALLQRGAIPDAARYARLAIDVDPGHADAHVNLGVALASLGDVEQARHHLTEALRLNPRHENARRNLQALASPRQ